MNTLFITGTGTDVGKTLISSILCEALQADYWKPVQAGHDPMTDSEWVKGLMTNSKTVVHPESYILKFPGSPHIAANDEEVEISLSKIVSEKPYTANNLIIEGAGGLMVPLNRHEFILDLILALKATVIIVSRNYLGSINHSLLTARTLRANNIKVLGWIFNDEYLDYENEITDWSGYPWIASVGKLNKIDKSVIHAHGIKMMEHLKRFAL